MLWGCYLEESAAVLYYCPLVVPDLTINYAINYGFTPVNYCPLVVPDLTINYAINYGFSTSNYCPLTIPDYSFTNAP